MRNAVINNLNAPDLRSDVGGLWEARLICIDILPLRPYNWTQF